MEWVVAESDAEAIGPLRSHMALYLRRHCTEDSDVHGAELIISELVTNAVRHTKSPVWVAIDWSGDQPELRVCDLGPGFDLDAELASATRLPPTARLGGRGLYIVHHLASRFDVVQRRDGGSVVTAQLPVTRSASPSIDPPRRRAESLPLLDEANDTRGFGREPFLRALALQLATAVAEEHGPAAAEAAVAQVGVDVGGQMEADFRRATGIVDRLTPQQLAECYVRLKSAIDGGFSIVQVADDRIVLANTRCPFGEAVRQAPSLCRMTSAVFGGIAARNADHSADVVLEERIAVGDERCTVVIRIDPPGDEAEAWTHRYRTPTP